MTEEELALEHAALMAEHADLLAEHEELERRSIGDPAHRPHATRLVAHIERLHRYMTARGMPIPHHRAKYRQR